MESLSRAERWGDAAWATLVGCSLVLALVVVLPNSASARPGHTEIVSVDENGSSRGTPGGTWLSSHPSRNGRFVVFETAESLVAEDTGGVDIYFRDRKTNHTELVSIKSDGTHVGLAGGSYYPSITPDARFTAFATASALVPEDVNLASDVYVRDRQKGRTELVSVSSEGKQGMMPLEDHASTEPSISNNGRYVAFLSAASDLVEDDTNGAEDAFVHDRKSGRTTRASVASDGSEAEGAAGWPNLSGNGRYVLFQDGDRTLDPDHNPELSGLYVRDLEAKKTEWLGIEGGGLPDGEGRAISGNGRYVTFQTFWPWFVPNDTNPAPLWGIDSFVLDRKTDRFERVSVSSFGEEGENSSGDPKISGDGRFVVFDSQADNLISGDTSPEGFPNNDQDALLHDRFTGATELLSVAPDGGQTPPCPLERAIGQSAFDPGISWDGRFASFTSCADGLDQPDDNGSFDVFVRERGSPLGVSRPSPSQRRVSLGGDPGFSRRGHVEMQDQLADVEPDGIGRGADIFAATLVHRPAYDDIFLKIDVDRMPGPRGGIGGLPAAGDPAILYGLTFRVGPDSYEVRVAKQDVTALSPDPVFGLFRTCRRAPGRPLPDQGPGCERQIAALRGGYGTVGESVVASIPLESLGTESRSLQDVRAYSSFGTFKGGIRRILDEVSLAPGSHPTSPMHG